MPRVSAIPPQILLAPTAEDDPLIPVEDEPEPLTKNVEIQTVSFQEQNSFLCILTHILLLVHAAIQGKRSAD